MITILIERVTSMASTSSNTPRISPPLSDTDVILGGFILKKDVWLPWAARIGQAMGFSPFDGTSQDFHAAHQIINLKIRKDKLPFDFQMVGNAHDTTYMIVTKRVDFIGYEGMDPALIPSPFQEGEHEHRVRRFLETEGECFLFFSFIYMWSLILPWLRLFSICCRDNSS